MGKARGREKGPRGLRESWAGEALRLSLVFLLDVCAGHLEEGLDLRRRWASGAPRWAKETPGGTAPSAQGPLSSPSFARISGPGPGVSPEAAEAPQAGPQPAVTAGGPSSGARSGAQPIKERGWVRGGDSSAPANQSRA